MQRNDCELTSNAEVKASPGSGSVVGAATTATASSATTNHGLGPTSATTKVAEADAVADDKEDADVAA